ncbi:hypothetical protein [Streptomyces aurantiacus]|uniref:hypothetical protein n=1 Tax=Streptomyces aurantiacus TaxID=47760 RepID=UPI0033E1ADC3
MAFGAEELRVLRRALALALQSSPASAQDVQDCLRLAENVDEATREGARLRAFLLADLARYRAALPGTAAGFLTLLEEALGAGHHPVPDDLTALRALRGNPVAAALLDRCQALAEQDVRTRLVRHSVPASRTHPRTRLTALPGGMVPAATEEPGRKPAEKPAGDPASRPGPRSPRRDRPIPTPGEVFPPKPKPSVTPASAPRQLAAV